MVASCGAPEQVREDLVQEGLLAAWQAEAAFDPARGVPREAWVAQKVRWAIRQAQRDADPLPASVRRDLRLLSAATERVEASGRQVSEALVAAESGIGVRRLRQARAWPTTVPLQDGATANPAGDGGGELWDEVAEALRALPDRDRAVLEQRYLQGVPVAQVALTRGISPGRVSQITHAALRRIRAHLQSQDPF